MDEATVIRQTESDGRNTLGWVDGAIMAPPRLDAVNQSHRSASPAGSRNLFQESGRNIVEAEAYGAYTQTSTQENRFARPGSGTGHTFNQQIINQKVVVDLTQMTQVEAVTINNNFVTIQTSINARMYQIQSAMTQEDPNRNPEVLRLRALEHAKEEIYQLRCQSIGI